MFPWELPKFHLCRLDFLHDRPFLLRLVADHDLDLSDSAVDVVRRVLVRRDSLLTWADTSAPLRCRCLRLRSLRPFLAPDTSHHARHPAPMSTVPKGSRVPVSHRDLPVHIWSCVEEDLVTRTLRTRLVHSVGDRNDGKVSSAQQTARTTNLPGVETLHLYSPRDSGCRRRPPSRLTPFVLDEILK